MPPALRAPTSMDGVGYVLPDRYLAPLLTAAGFRTLVMDLRGLGESDVGFQSHTPEDSGRDIVALIDDQHLENVVVVG